MRQYLYLIAILIVTLLLVISVVNDRFEQLTKGVLS